MAQLICCFFAANLLFAAPVMAQTSIQNQNREDELRVQQQIPVPQAKVDRKTFEQRVIQNHFRSTPPKRNN